MKKAVAWRDVIKKNYHQILFIFAAFFVMVLVSYVFVSGIVRNRLFTNADENLFIAESKIRATFSEAETSLNASFHRILAMLERNASQEEIREYLSSTTAWMRQTHRGLMGFYGIYGYIRGDFMDSMGLTPGKDYIPQTRPWYQAAARSGGAPVAYTTPYFDVRTGHTIISAVKNVLDPQGTFYGILAIDMDMAWISEYIETLHLGRDGYGMMVSKNMTIMIHPDDGALGKQLQELGGDFGDISRHLRGGREISALRYRDAEGRQIITFFRQIFNGWYVGIIPPTMDYYGDLYYAALSLSLLGLLLTCALSYLLLRISAAKMRADEESLSKTTFLAKMSHEIRTPMNAIIGMSELVLREELSPQVRNFADRIRQAGTNLLAIINDILDISKIESGKLDIINMEYQLASIINDVIAIIMLWLNEKPVKFITRIDGSLPAVLIGDEVRVRQVLLNLLTNAVKYTREGSITLGIRREKRTDDREPTPRDKPRILLAFEVADTGIGIKKEDMENLFENFTQFDQYKNRNVEGTGLGLVISRNLCHLMGGDITVQSDYGKGSVFTAFIPQLVKNDTPLAVVERPETKAVLVYEDRPLYAESIAYTIDTLGVNCAVARGRDDFVEQIGRGAWQFIFTSPSRYDEVQEMLKKKKPASSPAAEPVPVLLSEYGQALRRDLQTLLMPLQPVAAAHILNGEKSDTGGPGIESPRVRFIAPEARVLVVDDIEINLNVAEGLLAPYKMTIDCALGGLEAVRLVQKNRYDFVLMDHMMPGMDGIETAEAIRAWEKSRRKERPGEFYKELPIIALTANAVSGMKEMFLEKGFNDYISKPIEIAKLNEIMTRWIPPEKRIKTGFAVGQEPLSGGSLSIAGVDVKRGIAMTGGTEAGYRKVLAQFCKDAADRLPLFAAVPAGGELSLFTIQAHALKSAAATIGAAALSEEAAALEAAGKAGDAAALTEKLPGFHEALSQLIDGIGKALDEKKEAPAGPGGDEASPAAFHRSLAALKASLEAKDMKGIDRALGDLEKLPLAGKDRETVQTISDKVLMGEYQEAVEIIGQIHTSFV
jgi:signal transduction histidine kinase/HPt (histidine-containing phosphotransfer) domain-containing protein/ActR/RegA family two-component response regulator